MSHKFLLWRDTDDLTVPLNCDSPLFQLRTLHSGIQEGLWVSYCRSLAASLLSSELLTCFSLWQQMVQPPLHYPCSLFLLIYPRFNSLPTCLCLCFHVSVLVSAPLFSCLPRCLSLRLLLCFSLTSLSVCLCLWIPLSLTCWRTSVLYPGQSASLLFHVGVTK